ncbi:hypothetical protein [Streptomyces roseoverticillatus]|uniref:Uncharacterized protein n=1 Tax=Streptomyces roseoverticillatus TaxID=66429 RepID=A0ABV3ISS6_9ACTN
MDLPDIPRTIGGIAAALRPELQPRFWDEVRRIDHPDAAGLLLDDWWRQAVVDTAGDDEAARAALEDAADLHLIEVAREESGGRAMTHDEAMAVISEARAS